MIITRRFIFIHNPKTAGTWTIKAIKQAHIKLFITKTPLGELLYTIGKWLPFMRGTIAKIVDGLVIYNYSNYDLAKLSFRNYYDPLGRPKLKWFLLFAEAMFILDKNYETLLELRKHTRYAQLPKEFKSLPIVSGIRDPFSWHVSRYFYYKNWELKQGQDEAKDFINLLGEINNFEQYCKDKMMQLQNGFYQGYNNYISQQSNLDKHGEAPQYDDGLLSFYKSGEDKSPPAKHYGLMTLRFMQLHFKRPWEAINLPPKEFNQYWMNGDYKDNLPNITFLQQQNITQELLDYMLKLKYKEDILSEIKDIPPENTAADKSSQTSLYKFYDSSELINYIYKLEKPIFMLFPQYEDILQQLIKHSRKS